jgi:hypothetical protein
MTPGDLILLLDPYAQAGRTGHRLRVVEAKRMRMDARDQLGNSRADTPNVLELLRAAKILSALLHDATEGDAQLVVRLGKGESAELHAPGVVLSTIVAETRKGREP